MYHIYIHIYIFLLVITLLMTLGGSSFHFIYFFFYLFLHISVAAIFNQIAWHSIFINNWTFPGNKIIPMVIKEFSVLKHKSQVLHFLLSAVINKRRQGGVMKSNSKWSYLFPPRIIYILQDTVKCFVSFITTAVCNN